MTRTAPARRRPPRSRAAGPIAGTGSTTLGRRSGVLWSVADLDPAAPAGSGTELGLTTPHGLAQRSVGIATLSVFATAASAPMTVLAGGIVATYAATGVVATPLSFLVLAVALGLFTVGYAAMVRDVPHAASFAALLTRGVGTTTGAVGAAVALLSYNAIQFALYGLFGALATAQTAGLPVLGGHPWWAWAAAAWLVVTVLGVAHVALSARVVGAVLGAEIAVIGLFIVVGLGSPAEPIAAAVAQPLRVDLLATGGLGGVLALGVAAFIGFETVGVFREETRRAADVGPALGGTVGFLGVFYFLAAWALAVAAGPDRVVAASRDPALGPDLPFLLLADRVGPVFAVAGRLLLVVSVVGAMVAFHGVVARYTFTLGREHALPAVLGTTGGRGVGGVPTAASATQSALAAVVIVAFALSGADPLAGLFLWLSTLAALGVLTLMIATCVAVIAYYRARPAQPAPQQRPGRWTRLVAPALAAAALAVILAVTVANLSATVAADAAWLLPTIVAAAAGLGLLWAGWLRLNRPDAWAVLGRSRPAPLAVLDGAVSDLEL